MTVNLSTLSLYLASFFVLCNAFAEQGKWKFDVNQDHKIVGVIKGVYEDTNVFIKVLCDAPTRSTNVTISYVIGKLPCYQQSLDLDDSENLEKWHDDPQKCQSPKEDYPQFVECFHRAVQKFRCDHSIVLQGYDAEATSTKGPTTTATRVQSVTSVRTPVTVTSTKIETSTSTSSTSISNPPSQSKPPDSEDEGKTQNTAAYSEGRFKRATADDKAKEATAVEAPAPSPPVAKNALPQYVIQKEGIFIITIKVESESNFSATVELEVFGHYGYLSAVDWPLLPFYGSMCVIYFIYGLSWLIVLALQWRDLLRIQFWIGGVIFLGMIEKAVFYAEYQSVNSTGNSVQGAVLFAELVSCLKRTLARMLVVIVSLGFGIVKPRLGPMLHRVVGIGGIYFLLCSLEAFLRVMRPKNDPSKTLMLAEVPLAILDTAICWWIFSNLVQTTRTLRLRRNIVKLSLYRHFTNTLIFACIASVAFMVWVYKAHNLPKCVTDWKELWVDDAYWHLLFSVILLVIMILWRPTNNNQRYAFTPLIDAADEEEDDAVMNDAFDGMKSRGLKTQNASGTPKEKEPLRKKGDEDLAWVEENIPASLADSALPSLLDSDEEIMNTKFEISKME